LNNALDFIEDVNSTNSNIYLFAGQPSPFTAGGPTTPQYYDDVNNVTYAPYHAMLFGKLVANNDVCPVVSNYNWVSNTVYAKFDDQDPLLSLKQFYVVINASAYSHVFKCLDNHFGVPSTIPPNFSDVDANDSSYRTSDGYLWKYLFTCSSFTVGQFGSLNYFPYQPNTAVQVAAINGAIDVIEVNSIGIGYSNYVNGTFSVADIRLQGNNLLYSIVNAASATTNFYNGCVLYVTADPNGNATGLYETIVQYTVNATTQFVQLANPFSVSPQNGAQYQIYPGVNIVGDGYQTVNAFAWAVVNASTNTIDRVEMLQRGAGYVYAAAQVVSSNTVGVSNAAVLNPIQSPPGGHGANPLAELYCNTVCVELTFDRSETNTLPVVNQYQQIGLIKNPQFANVEVHLTNATGGFIIAETVYKISNPIELQGSANLYNNTTITASNSDFLNQLTVGSYVYLTDQATYHQFCNVISVINSSMFIVASNTNSSAANISIYQVRSKSIGPGPTVIKYNTGVVNLTGITNPFNVGDFIIGAASGAVGNVSAVYRNGVLKNFNTFVQCFVYNVTSNTGTFTPNEVVFQTNMQTANALLFSANASTILTTNQIGAFTTSQNVVGNSSGASATISAVYTPELTFGSGDVLYIENMTAIPRNANQAEQFQLYLSF